MLVHPILSSRVFEGKPSQLFKKIFSFGSASSLEERLPGCLVFKDCVLIWKNTTVRNHMLSIIGGGATIYLRKKALTYLQSVMLMTSFEVAQKLCPKIFNARFIAWIP